MEHAKLLSALVNSAPYETRIMSDSKSQTMIDMVVTHRFTEGSLRKGRPVKADVIYKVTIARVVVKTTPNLLEALKAANASE